MTSTAFAEPQKPSPEQLFEEMESNNPVKDTCEQIFTDCSYVEYYYLANAGDKDVRNSAILVYFEDFIKCNGRQNCTWQTGSESHVTWLGFNPSNADQIGLTDTFRFHGVSVSVSGGGSGAGATVSYSTDSITTVIDLSNEWRINHFYDGWYGSSFWGIAKLSHDSTGSMRLGPDNWSKNIYDEEYT